MAHWRETFKPARFVILDARAGVPLLVTLLHIRPWTLIVATVIIILFVVVERQGFSLPSAFRAARAWAIGDARPAKGNHKVRAHIDYSRRDI